MKLVPKRDASVATRLTNLQVMREGEFRAVTRSAQAVWSQGLQPAPVRIRRPYVARATRMDVEDERTPLPLQDRPPAARMLTPKGVALKLHLVLLFAAQCAAKAGKPWNSPFPVEPASSGRPEQSWMGLVGTVARYNGAGIQGASAKTNKRRQITEALNKLEGLNLVRPLKGKGRSRQGFVILSELGQSDEAVDVAYTVPAANEAVFEIPVEFFTQGWVHVLTNSEIAALLMWFDRTKVAGQSVNNLNITHVASKERQGIYGLGRETYETHQQLDAFELLDVIRPDRRHLDGKWQNYSADESSALCHRVAFVDNGFDRPADEVVLEVLERRYATGDWWRRPNAARGLTP